MWWEVQTADVSFVKQRVSHNSLFLVEFKAALSPIQVQQEGQDPYM